MALNHSSSLAPQPWTDIFTNDTCIDRRQCHRTVPMKVLVLGTGRTGTASIRAALQRLGYNKTYHMMSASVENPPDCLMWHDALCAKYDGVGKFGRAEWDQLLGDCQAVCDWPACAFAKELVEAYPNAKVVLNTRDVDPWYESVRRTVYWRAKDPEHYLASKVSWAASMYYPMLNKFFDTFFRGDFIHNGKQVYLDHIAEVRSIVPPENLLEYKVSEGWGPLCKFLGDDIPEIPFPRVNDVSDFQQRCSTRNRRQMMNAALQAAIFGGTILVTGLVLISFIQRYL